MPSEFNSIWQNIAQLDIDAFYHSQRVELFSINNNKKKNAINKENASKKQNLNQVYVLNEKDGREANKTMLLSGVLAAGDQRGEKALINISEVEWITKNNLSTSGYQIKLKGVIENIQFNGYGEYIFPNGARYYGHLFNGVRHGTGEYINPSRTIIYLGQWDQGKRNGHGELVELSPQKKLLNYYVGNWKDNEKSGYGKQLYSTGSVYIGDWSRNVPEGEGIMLWKSIDQNKAKQIFSTYNEASFDSTLTVRDLVNEINIQFRSEIEDISGVHQLYQGKWRNGKMHGSGIEIWMPCQNREETVAKSVENPTPNSNVNGSSLFNLSQIFNFRLPLANTPEKEKYLSFFFNLSNPGVMSLALHKYMGEYYNGMREGFGEFYYSNGSIYRGQWENNRKHGKGIFINENGDCMSCSFKENRPEFNLESSPLLRNIDMASDNPIELMVNASGLSSLLASDGYPNPEREVFLGLQIILRRLNDLRTIYMNYRFIGGVRPIALHDSKTNPFGITRWQLWCILNDLQLISPLFSYALVDKIIETFSKNRGPMRKLVESSVRRLNNIDHASRFSSKFNTLCPPNNQKSCTEEISQNCICVKNSPITPSKANGSNSLNNNQPSSSVILSNGFPDNSTNHSPSPRRGVKLNFEESEERYTKSRENIEIPMKSTEDAFSLMKSLRETLYDKACDEFDESYFHETDCTPRNIHNPFSTILFREFLDALLFVSYFSPPMKKWETSDHKKTVSIAETFCEKLECVLSRCSALVKSTSEKRSLIVREFVESVSKLENEIQKRNIQVINSIEQQRNKQLENNEKTSNRLTLLNLETNVKKATMQNDITYSLNPSFYCSERIKDLMIPIESYTESFQQLLKSSKTMIEGLWVSAQSKKIMELLPVHHLLIDSDGCSTVLNQLYHSISEADLTLHKDTDLGDEKEKDEVRSLQSKIENGEIALPNWGIIKQLSLYEDIVNSTFSRQPLKISSEDDTLFSELENLYLQFTTEKCSEQKELEALRLAETEEVKQITLQLHRSFTGPNPYSRQEDCTVRVQDIIMKLNSLGFIRSENKGKWLHNKNYYLASSGKKLLLSEHCGGTSKDNNKNKKLLFSEQLLKELYESVKKQHRVTSALSSTPLRGANALYGVEHPLISVETRNQQEVEEKDDGIEAEGSECSENDTEQQDFSVIEQSEVLSVSSKTYTDAMEQFKNDDVSSDNELPIPEDNNINTSQQNFAQEQGNVGIMFERPWFNEDETNQLINTSNSVFQTISEKYTCPGSAEMINEIINRSDFSITFHEALLLLLEGKDPSSYLLSVSTKSEQSLSRDKVSSRKSKKKKITSSLHPKDILTIYEDEGDIKLCRALNKELKQKAQENNGIHISLLELLYSEITEAEFMRFMQSWIKSVFEKNAKEGEDNISPLSLLAEFSKKVIGNIIKEKVKYMRPVQMLVKKQKVQLEVFEAYQENIKRILQYYEEKKKEIEEKQSRGAKKK